MASSTNVITTAKMLEGDENNVIQAQEEPAAVVKEQSVGPPEA